MSCAKKLPWRLPNFKKVRRKLSTSKIEQKSFLCVHFLFLFVQRRFRLKEAIKKDRMERDDVETAAGKRAGRDFASGAARNEVRRRAADHMELGLLLTKDPQSHIPSWLHIDQLRLSGE